MIVHPHPDPVAFAVFGLPIRWYALMYLAGFAIAWGIAAHLRRRASFADMRDMDAERLLTSAVLGVIIGGRLGYVLFYNPAFYFAHPAEIFAVWKGGMSFHGGLVGVIAAMWLISARDAARTRGAAFLRVLDFAAVLTPPGLGLGRLGNFINGELPGRVVDADLPWAFSFGAPDFLPRHPSQLYQFFAEGVLLTVLMLWLARRPHAAGTLAGAFILAYGIGRFCVEFFREPDAHLGLLFLDLSMGQLLSLPMIAVGGAMIAAPLLLAMKRGERRVPVAVLRDMLLAAPAEDWSAPPPREKRDYEDELEDEERGDNVFSRFFGGAGDDDARAIPAAVHPTRRQKRRLRKKKRKKNPGAKR